MAKKKDMSERQKKILQYIADYISTHTRPPTIREIGSNVDISSTSVVNYNLTRLVERGMIERESEVSRGLRLTNAARKFLGFSDKSKVVNGSLHIPFLGAIVAGEPIESFEGSGEDMVEIGAMLFGDDTDDLYALRVKGDSMIDAMINEGDTVILRHQTTARNGDMVAAWISDGQDETTLKYFYHEGDRVRLEPANPNYDSIFVDPAKVEIQGKVEMVIRHP